MSGRRLPIRRGAPGRGLRGLGAFVTRSGGAAGASRSAHPTRAGRRAGAAFPGIASPAGPGIRRASAGISPPRAAALLGLLLSGLALYGVTTADVFGLRTIEISDLRFTDPVAVRARLPVMDGANLFAVSTETLVARLAGLPAVASVHLEIALPDRLVISIEERSPILVWQVDDRRYLVDRTGVLFADVAATPGGGAATIAGLPVVVDRRLSSEAALDQGDSIDPIVLDAATRLASLRPADLGSVAPGLAVELSDENGFTVGALPDGWLAIFGFYTANLRTTDLIPGQVRLLRSLLADREATVERVVLADDTNGTYLPKPTPKPTPTARPTATPRPTATRRP